MKIRNLIYGALFTALLAVWVTTAFSGMAIYDWQGSHPNAGETQVAFATTLYTEVFKYVIQYSLIALLAAVLVKEYERARTKRDEAKKFRQETSAALVKTYLTVKRARWSLRANHHDGGIEFSTYQKAIKQLVELKSKVEALEFAIEAFPKAFKGNEKADLLSHIETMENYIDKVVDECASLPKPPTMVVMVADYPILRDFIRNRDKDRNEVKADTPFGKGYRVPVKAAISALNPVGAYELKLPSIRNVKTFLKKPGNNGKPVPV